jgi:hypothetical protein
MRSAAEKALIVGFHFSFPSLGHVEKDGAGYRLVPVACETDDEKGNVNRASREESRRAMGHSPPALVSTASRRAIGFCGTW